MAKPPPLKTDTGKDQGIEYTIQTLEPEKDAKPEVQGMKTEMADAMAFAEELLASGKYKKVEVRQKYFDKKSNREIDTTLKVLMAKKKIEFTTPVIFVIAVLCGGIAFGVTYFLSK